MVYYIDRIGSACDTWGMDKKPIEIAVAWAGSKKELARRLGIGKAAVSTWGDNIPEGRAYQIEVISRGKVKAADLLRGRDAA